jgi:hypothetical protein
MATSLSEQNRKSLLEAAFRAVTVTYCTIRTITPSTHQCLTCGAGLFVGAVLETFDEVSVQSIYALREEHSEFDKQPGVVSSLVPCVPRRSRCADG